MPNLEDKIVSSIVVYLDNASQNIPAYLYAKQYDSQSRYINATLMTAAGKYVPDGNCRLNATNPNGTQFYVMGEINTDGTVTFEVTANMLAVVGNLACDISIYESASATAALLTSSAFYIVVDRSNYNADAVEGADQFPVGISDLQLTSDNNLHLINSDGDKVGNGVILSSSGGGGGFPVEINANGRYELIVSVPMPPVYDGTSEDIVFTAPD